MCLVNISPLPTPTLALLLRTVALSTPLKIRRGSTYTSPTLSGVRWLTTGLKATLKCLLDEAKAYGRTQRHLLLPPGTPKEILVSPREALPQNSTPLSVVSAPLKLQLTPKLKWSLLLKTTRLEF